MRESLVIIVTVLFLLGGITRGYARSVMLHTMPTENNPYGHNIFQEGEPVQIKVVFVQDRVRLRQPLLRYRVSNFWGEEIQRGELVPSIIGLGGNAILDLGLLDPGWYRVELEILENGEIVPVQYQAKDDPLGNLPMITCAVVPRVQLKDSPFGVDAGVSWFSPDNNFGALADVIRLSGVSYVRDRLRWAEVQPEPGVYRWEHYDQSVQAQLDSDLTIISVFHDSPPWARSREHHLDYPEDLRSVYEFARETARRYPEVYSWQVWNEHDHTFSREPADYYAALLKAAALGYHDGGAPTVMLGPLAHPPAQYMEDVLLNGVLPYVDGYSFHTYANAVTDAYDQVLAEHINFAARQGLAPVWLTETGLPVLDVFPEPKLQEQVEYLVKGYTKALASGVKGVFWFILPQVATSDNKYWGMVRSDLTPLPVYAALAAMTSTLGEATYLGSYEVPQATLAKTRIEVFDSGQGQVAVAWSQIPRTLAVQGEQITVVDVMGKRQTIIGEEGVCRVQLQSMPVYILGASWEITNPSYTGIASEVSGEPSRVILRNRFSVSCLPEERTAPPMGYLVGIEPLDLTVEVYNFSDVSQRGVVEIFPPSGFTVNPVRVEVVLGPQERRDIAVQLTPPSSYTQDSYFLRVEGRFGEMLDVAVSRLMVDWETTGTWYRLEDVLDEVPPWRPSIAAGGRTSIDGSGTVVKFTHEFREGLGSWSSPHLEFAKPVDLSQYVGIRFLVSGVEVPPSAQFTLSMETVGGLRYRSRGYHVLTSGPQEFVYLFSDFTQPSWIEQTAYRPIDLRVIRRLDLGFVLEGPTLGTIVSYEIVGIELLGRE